MEKEKWKDEVLESLAGIKPAEPGQFLFTRIEARLQEKTNLSVLQVRLAAACMILLIAFNLWVVTTRYRAEITQNSITTTYQF